MESLGFIEKLFDLQFKIGATDQIELISEL